MAFRWEKNHINGEAELVIDGFDKGIADSPYQGIASLKNFNIKYYPGVAYVNYKQRVATLASTNTIALDTSDYIGSTSFIADGATHTLTKNYTCTGSNRLLVVQTKCTKGAASGVTYNGVALTKLSDALNVDNIGQTFWYLIAPATGSNSLVVSAAPANDGSYFAIQANAVSYTGVRQNSIPDASTTNVTKNVSSETLSVTTVSANCWTLIGSSTDGSTETTSAGAGTTQRQNNALQAVFVSALVVAGGGGGGDGGLGSGGGAAGGYKTDLAHQVTIASYPITVGAGGPKATSGHFGSNGSNSVFDTITALGGGGGGPNSGTDSGRDGGSGGGAGTGTGNAGNGTAGQGNNGGASSTNGGGGGGGSSGVGGNGSVGVGGAPGTGTSNSITGAPVTYATGGRGNTGSAGAANTGNGGDGESDGGSGIVVISYPTGLLTATGGTITTSGGNTIHTFNSNGTFQITAVSAYTIDSKIFLGDSNAAIASPGSTSLIATFSGSVTNASGIMISIPPLFTAGQFTFACQSPTGLIYLIDTNGNVQKQDAVGGHAFSLLTGNPAGGAGQGIAFWNNYLIVFRATAIDYCGDGTGDAGVIAANWNTATSWPIALTASVSLTGTPAAAATSATLSAAWPKPTGTYKGTIALTGGPPNSQDVSLSLTNGSTAVTWTPGLWLAASGTTITNVTAVNSGTHMSFVSSNDGYLYYQNGSSVGALAVPAGQTFNPLVKASYTVNYSALGLPTYESVSWISELRTNLLVGGIRRIYPWDRVSTSWSTPIPVTEPIGKITNIMNNIYIFAGNKGNIYFSNGYSVAPIKKIPDSFLGYIDPAIIWGGFMAHRLKLWFQFYAKDSVSGNGIASGIMSLDTITQALNFENENSPGFVPAGTSGVGNVLVDISDVSSSNFDNYISSWYNNGTGGLDYNDQTLYQNNEPQIESDLIPVGTYAQPRTFNSIEFKLDKPLATGDSITVYARNSLGDSYTLVGTTTSAVLSDFYSPVSFEKNQWLQIKVTASCATSSSSFIRIREIRLR